MSRLIWDSFSVVYNDEGLHLTLPLHPMAHRSFKIASSLLESLSETGRSYLQKQGQERKSARVNYFLAVLYSEHYCSLGHCKYNLLISPLWLVNYPRIPNNSDLMIRCN